MSRDLIEYGLGWKWTAARIHRCLHDDSTNVAVAREGNDLVAGILNVSQVFVGPFEGILGADALHSADNMAKMAAGRPLDDEDRWHWLLLVRDELLRDNGIVVACSALKRSYRDVLRQADGIDFVHLDVDPATAHERIGRRRDHFMGPAMVTSQFEALERPSADEDDVVTVDATRSLVEVMEQVRAGLSRRSTIR